MISLQRFERQIPGVAGEGRPCYSFRTSSRMLDWYSERFDYIVTDPPYGARQARRTSLARLYRSLLEAFEARLTESGRIVLIVLKYRTFLAALEPVPLRIVDEVLVDLGGMSPRIVRLSRV